MSAPLTALVGGAERVVVLTGAGISTDSGIPDFRGPQGTWTLDPTAERLTHWPSYRDEEQIRRRSWRWRVSNPALTAEPNPAHRALAAFAGTGRLTALATQNTDGLHAVAGTPPELLHELHGSARRVRCAQCAWEAPMRWGIERVEAGDDDPRCPDCGAITRACTVMFGEALPQDTLEACIDAAAHCDLIVAIGTSLTVHPVAGLPELAVRHGATLAIVNAEPTPLDRLATLVERTPIAASVPAAFGGVSS